MKQHRHAPEVEAELDGIWYHIATKSGSVEIADRVIENITERFWLLARNPHIGRRRDDDLRPGLRSFPADDYIIFYRIESDGVLNFARYTRQQRYSGAVWRVNCYRVA